MSQSIKIKEYPTMLFFVSEFRCDGCGSRHGTADTGTEFLCIECADIAGLNN